MPCLELSIPKLDLETKKHLAERLTSALADIFEKSVEIFGVRFLEYTVGETANAGVLWDGKTGKPYHHFFLHVGQMRPELKKKVIEALTNIYTETVGRPDWQPVIFICEYPYDNIGVRGRTLAEQRSS